MSDERCKHEMIKEFCRPIPIIDAPDPFEDPTDGRDWTVAHYPGVCDGCGVAFEAHEQIRPNGKHGWVGRNCCGVPE